MTTYLVFVLISAFQQLTTFAANPVFTHKTRLGEVNGIEVKAYNTTIYQFKKIPYAKPPLSSLRFEKPQPFGSWNDTLNATEYGPNCMQNFYSSNSRLIPNHDKSEDCLHLNIFAPRDVNKNSRRPVMIWIHGGSFTNGQGMKFNGTKLAAVGDVIIITINYRLNVFGFANAGVGSVRNIGLWDQRFAIIWVKNNIEDYGGNPNMITIFGESSGGVSVELQAMSPKNKGLFQRAISQSIYIDGIRDRDSYESLTREIGRLLNCSECKNGVNSCLDCLRTVPASNLLKAYSDGYYNINSGFGPTIDGDFIPASPVVMLSNPSSESSQMFNSIDYMAGINDCESAIHYYYSIKEEKHFDLTNGIPTDYLCNYSIPYISRVYFIECDKLSQEICKKYSPTDKSNSLSHETSLAINVHGDFGYASVTTRDLDFHTRSRKGTFQYLFTHKPTWGLLKERPSWSECGANHGDEIAFIFGLETWYPKDITITQYESKLSSKMMTFWTNFAKTGNPNQEGKHEWPAYNKTSTNFMVLVLKERHRLNKASEAKGTKQANKAKNQANKVKGTKQANKAEGANQANKAKGTNQANKAKGTNQSNKAEGTNQAKTAEGTNKANKAKGTNQTNKAEGTNQAKTAEGTNKAKTAEGTNKAKTAEGTNKANKAKGTNQTNKAEGTNQANKAKGTNQSNKAEGTNQAKTAEGTNKADKAKGTNQSNKAEGTNQSNKAEGTNQANKAEGTNQANKAKGTNQANKAKGTNQTNKAEGTNQTNKAEGTNQTNKAEGTNQANKAEGTNQANKAEGTNQTNKAEGTNQTNKAEGTNQSNKAEEQIKQTKQREQIKQTKQREQINQTKQREQIKQTKQREQIKQTKQREQIKQTKQREQIKQTKQREQIKQTKQREQIKQTKQREQINQTKQREQIKQTKQREQIKQTKQREQIKQTKQTCPLLVLKLEKHVYNICVFVKYFSICFEYLYNERFSIPCKTNFILLSCLTLIA
ncbi:Ribosome-binding protein 1,Putative inactive carboxylesterase 4 [Mytilus coruscus]|uniref:Ribosome-binding protein 1,Putative inactive carboxylesterase 4 n=1 Tax=Mytilus coruscus TaxID=42192 RepID=A0A6J8DKW9_MYTCO|nr:Ribosome-binding protein 1,Putative inactive carboxylesterase 4 [Mytilus coruscus]